MREEVGSAAARMWWRNHQDLLGQVRRAFLPVMASTVQSARRSSDGDHNSFERQLLNSVTELVTVLELVRLTILELDDEPGLAVHFAGVVVRWHRLAELLKSEHADRTADRDAGWWLSRIDDAGNAQRAALDELRIAAELPPQELN